MEYEINKGVGKTVEFKGLQSRYLIGFFVGIFIVFILFIVLRVAAVPLFVNLVIVFPSLGALVWYTFHFNKKYGRYGLMKGNARRRCPRFITSRKSVYIMLQNSNA